MSQAQSEGSAGPLGLLKPRRRTFLAQPGPEPRVYWPVPLFPRQEEDLCLKIHRVGMSHRGSQAVAMFNQLHPLNACCVQCF